MYNTLQYNTWTVITSCIMGTALSIIQDICVAPIISRAIIIYRLVQVINMCGILITECITAQEQCSYYFIKDACLKEYIVLIEVTFYELRSLLRLKHYVSHRVWGTGCILCLNLFISEATLKPGWDGTGAGKGNVDNPRALYLLISNCCIKADIIGPLRLQTTLSRTQTCVIEN